MTLQGTFISKIEFRSPAIHLSLILRIAVKAVNDVIGENVLVSSRLVFEIIPMVSILSNDLFRQKDL